MGKKKHRYPVAKTDSNRTAKRWNPDFFKNRRQDGIISEPLFIESLRRSKIQRSNLDAFLQDYEILDTSWEVEQVRKFFREKKSVPEVKVWVDHRSKTASFGQSTSKWLTARELADFLEQQRSESKFYRGVSRHLIFAPQLTPNVIETLIETATCHEIEALRPAVRQHIAGETLIRVLVPVSGFSNYRLLLNVPYLVLEDRNKTQSRRASSVEDQTKVLWEDLSSLSLESSTGEPSQDFAIYESQITLVIFGCDHTRWRGYAFGMIGLDDLCPGDDGSSESDDNSDDNDDDEDQDSFSCYEEDYFAGGGCGPTRDPTELIWDPRTYFLRAAQTRLEIVTSAYGYLVKKIEAGAKDWIAPTPGNHESNQMALERVTHLSFVFQRLRKHFSQAIRAWSNFNGDGDVKYFADLNLHVAREALSGITKSFEEIFDLEQRLTLMESKCEKLVTILQLRMTQENNRISLESNRMNRRMTDIVRVTSRYSKQAAQSAAKGTKAAEETSRATRVNIQLVVMFTAVAIALQYFCSDRALFAFERTPRAFWISVGILIPSLAVIGSLLHAIDYYKGALLHWAKKQRREAVSSTSSVRLDGHFLHNPKRTLREHSNISLNGFRINIAGYVEAGTPQSIIL